MIEPSRGGIIGVEIKCSKDPRPAEFQAGFDALSQVVKPRKVTCVCRAPHPRSVGSAEILPWRAHFELLAGL